MKPKDFVAEAVLGFERKNCYGPYGGGNISTSGSEHWFYCQWCGRRIDNGVTEPCPKYPFPEFDMLTLMKGLGAKGHSIHLRYDPIRTANNFTIILDDIRICDTDTPLESLCRYLAKSNLG